VPEQAECRRLLACSDVYKPCHAPAIQSDAKPNPGQQYLITRRFTANIRGSLHQFSSAGNDAATWSPQAGKIGDVFGISEIFETGADVSATTAVLQNAVLHKVTVLEQKNDFPVSLGVSISSIPSDEVTKTGHKYAITAMSQSYNPTPCVVFSAEEASGEGIEWRNKYPTYNSSNLEGHGVLEVQGQAYVFVSQNHPVVELLANNAEILNAQIKDQPLIDGEWYKITRQVMSQCCGILRNKVLNKVSTRDLNNFSIQIHRLGHRDWVSCSNNDEILSALPIGAQAKTAEEVTSHVQMVQRTPYSYNVRLEVQYECQM
jgi:hypothetical protein